MSCNPPHVAKLDQSISKCTRVYERRSLSLAKTASLVLSVAVVIARCAYDDLPNDGLEQSNDASRWMSRDYSTRPCRVVLQVVLSLCNSTRPGIPARDRHIQAAPNRLPTNLTLSSHKRRSVKKPRVAKAENFVDLQVCRSPEGRGAVDRNGRLTSPCAGKRGSGAEIGWEQSVIRLWCLRSPSPHSLVLSLSCVSLRRRDVAWWWEPCVRSCPFDSRVETAPHKTWGFPDQTPPCSVLDN